MEKIWKKAKNLTIFREKKEKEDKSVLIAASIIAAMAYQAAISPPGGVASMDAQEVGAPDGAPLAFFGMAPAEGLYLYPSDSLLAYFYSGLSRTFSISNTMSFIAALSVVFLYVSGSSLKRRVFIWLLRAAMWLTLTSMAVAYVCAVLATTPSDGFQVGGTAGIVFYGLCAWFLLISLCLCVIAYRFFSYIKSPKRATKNKNTSQDPITFPTPNTDIV